MKAAVYSKNGGPEVFAYIDVADPIADQNQVLIKVEAISIEGGDLTNRLLSSPPTENYIVGYAAAGEIIGLGANVSSFKLGQKVITFSWSGSHAALRAVDASATYLIPEGMDAQLAIASFIGVGTAALAIHLSNIKSGQRVLVSGATGGVGNAVVQLLTHQGIETIATGRSADTLDSLKQLGVWKTIVSGETAIHDQVSNIDKSGVDVFIDTVGLAVLIDGIKAVKNGGKVVLIAGRAGTGNYIDPLYILSHRLTVIGCLLGAVMQEKFVADLLEKSLRLVAEGKIKVPIHKVFKLADAESAHREAEKSGKFGRIIMVP
ncbi:zinc-binding alcohol dehydrogenase family protein [Pedobacter sp. MC2016-05]|uniref:quinone oxidoreductase family protein n=1 Tax=Pedobacter sp. MC2016-05 TaxID=2994474 RepID=UPI002245B470|nr:zinc-binding alcohol dehydrogenase family protein [Pedobacter sp. MC2016-05]MCX2477189.1 zinc-binding alcohol dehydrogenase family protein [Pedobacter sp. MC2016-05]